MRLVSLILLYLCSVVSLQAQSHADQVKAIQEDPRVQAAFDHIDKNKDPILREWIAITEVNAPSKQEQERAKFIESLLRKHKLDIRYDIAGNLIAELGRYPDLDSAREAFDAAVRHRPQRRLYLRRSARVIARHEPPAH